MARTVMSASPATGPFSPRARVGHLRWVICGMLFLVTVSNYVDRQAISIIAPVISAKFRFTNSDIATIVSAFLIAYTFGQSIAGIFMDWIGSKRGFSILVILWSLASIFTSFARGVLSFSCFRFLLGLTESGNFGGGVKVVAEWFPENERSTAVGLFISGASIGAILTPPLVAFLVAKVGWQAAFVLVGIPGLLWVLWWRSLYAPVVSHPRISEGERAYIQRDHHEVRFTRRQGQQWFSVLKHRMFWGVFLGRFVEEPASWFYLTWLPLYLSGFRGVSLMNIGFFLIIPFSTLDLGYMGGGWVASRLIKRGWSLSRARKAVMAVSAFCMVAAIPAVLASSTVGFVLLVSVATLGHGGWAANIMTLPGDMVPHRLVGTLYGMTALGGGLGSIVFMQITGKLVDMQRSFNTVFIIAGILPLIALVIILSVTGKIELMRLPGITEETVPAGLAAAS
jgi:ACS family hexuronate transporter-like MFS transporter